MTQNLGWCLKSINAFLLLLLTGCTNAALELAETPGQYLDPIGKNQWAYTAYGFYLNRNTEFGERITYEILYDNRARKAQLMRDFTVTDGLRWTYPSFIRHKGKTDCGMNHAAVDQLGERMEVLYSKTEYAMTEVAINLCAIKNLSENN